jgi:hypothetical protein
MGILRTFQGRRNEADYFTPRSGDFGELSLYFFISLFFNAFNPILL